MTDNPNPSGATMLARAMAVKANVRAQLPAYPPGRGNHPLNYLYYLKHYCWRLVHVQTKPKPILTYASFDAFRMCPSFETVRRRTQEIQHDERERIWKEVAVLLGWVNPRIFYGEPEEQARQKKEWQEREDDWRGTNTARAEFDKLAKKSDLLPTKRTREKRNRNENVHEEYYSDKQMGLEDY